ncbi:hypothetical protein BU16DRAFT_535475 [Lophium mytilinum]|uniref:Uncharacterized protein n=1 Tax=Lophium mytilinum TaxID=390894 RepID=A0A6A6R3D2_9PEZI|nr:hypothetical protein BU16DRAFT_535475 [Lophium mytilinum]
MADSIGWFSQAARIAPAGAACYVRHPEKRWQSVDDEVRSRGRRKTVVLFQVLEYTGERKVVGLKLHTASLLREGDVQRLHKCRLHNLGCVVFGRERNEEGDVAVGSGEDGTSPARALQAMLPSKILTSAAGCDRVASVRSEASAMMLGLDGWKCGKG